MITNAEVQTVSFDEIVVTFSSDNDNSEITTKIGDQSFTTTGANHVVTAADLVPQTRYAVQVGDAEPTNVCPPTVTTLAKPSGELLCTIATVNDVHFGETVCGKMDDRPEIGPVLETEPGETPYPVVMNRGAIKGIQVLAPDVVIAKGDLTDSATQDQYQEFLDHYENAFGSKLLHFRGNHDYDVGADPVREKPPFFKVQNGVGIACIDTSLEDRPGGGIDDTQIGWLDDIAQNHDGPILVFGHHHLWTPNETKPDENYYGVRTSDSEKLLDVIKRNENIHGYFSGHTHRNRVVKTDAARNIPLVEVASTKEYPGSFAEYRVFEVGYTQIHRRITDHDALAWSEMTRQMFFGLFRAYALGEISDRCFTHQF